MAHIKCMVVAAVFMVAFAVAKANQCSSGGECSGGNKLNNVVLMLQTKLQMNALKDEGGEEMAAAQKGAAERGAGRLHVRTKKKNTSPTRSSRAQVDSHIGSQPEAVDLPNTEKCLNFLHIPKDAGATMEDIRRGRAQMLAEAGDSDESHVGWGWGESILSTIGCTNWTAGTTTTMGCEIGEQSALQNASRMDTPSTGESCPVFHYPPAYDPLVAAGYLGCQTFCIVRHPLTKAISQHIFNGGECNLASFAETIRQKAVYLQTHPFTEACHWLPQTTYIGENGKYCQRLLKFENLAGDFNSLMAEYGYPMTLGAHHVTHGFSHCDLADHSEDIPADVAEWIERFYAADYAQLGYSTGNSSL